MNKINYTIELRLKDNNVSAQINKWQSSFAILNIGVKKVNQTFDAVAAGISGSIARINDNIQSLSRNFKSVSADMSGNITGLNTDIQDFSQVFNTVAIEISGSVAEISADLQEVNQVAEGMADKINQKVGEIDFQGVVDKTKNFFEAFKTLSDSGIGFEQSMANLSAATGITGKDLKKLEDIARETGKASGIGATAAADSFAQLADQVKTDKIGMEELKTLQKETITLAQSSGMSMADAATAMAITINEFGLKVSSANKIINVLAAGSKNGSATINELAQSFKITGAVASSAGLSIEETTGALEILSQNNLKGAEAGTVLQSMLQNMQAILGMDIGKTGFSAAIETLKPRLNDISFLTKTFGADNLEAAQFLITNASAVNTMTTALTGTSVAQEQAAIRTSTTSEKMKQMQATVDDIKIGFFNLTGGTTAYITAMGDSAVMVAQMLPLFSAFKSGVELITTANGRATITTTALAVAEKSAAAGTWLMTAANTALNAVLNANPIAMITLAVAALVAGIVIAYNNCEAFRTTINNVWTGIKQLAFGIWNTLVVAFEKVSAVIDPLWSKLKSLLGIQDEVAQSNTKVAIEITKVAQAHQEGQNAVIGLANSLDSQNQKLNTNLSTIGGVEQKLSDLRVAQKAAMEPQAVALEKEIKLWEKKRKVLEDNIIIGAAKVPELKPLTVSPIPSLPTKGKEGSADIDTKDLKTAEDRIESTKKKVVSFTESIWGANSVIGQFSTNASSGVTKLIDIFTEYDAMLKNNTLTTTQTVFGSMQAMAAVMGTVGGALSNSSGEWLSWGANLLAVIATAVPQLLTLFGVQVAVGVAEQTKLAFPLNILAIGATIAGVAAALVSIPKPKAFASGGIVYGNTFAQVGEYPGAANNPEVIAPLSKLKSLIQPVVTTNGVYEFRIKGRDLVAVARKLENINGRTR